MIVWIILTLRQIYFLKQLIHIMKNVRKPPSIDMPNPILAYKNSEIHIIDSALQSQQSPYFSRTKTDTNELWLTQRKVFEVDHAHKQLLDYIDVLDQKITTLVQTHEAEFLIAYRNHITRVRKQMEALRDKTLSNQKSAMTQTEQIDALEKKLIIFREESLKMFDKVTQKEKIIEYLENKISDLSAENKNLTESVKNLTKRNKILEGMREQKQREIQEQDPPTFHLTRPDATVDTSMIEIKTLYNRPYTTAFVKTSSAKGRRNTIQIQRNNETHKSINLEPSALSRLLKKVEELEGNEKTKETIKSEIGTLFRKKNVIDTQDSFAIQQTSKTKRRSYHHFGLRGVGEEKKKNEIQEYFLKCVETVKKQIVRRKGVKSINFYQQHGAITLEEFKKVDFFRLLQLVFNHESIIQKIYQWVIGENEFI